MINRPFQIKAVLFDFDGTLTQSGAIDFSVIKKAMGCPVDSPVLEFIDGLGDPSEREKARAILNRFENRAAENSKPNDGAENLLSNLSSKGVPFGRLGVQAGLVDAIVEG